MTVWSYGSYYTRIEPVIEDKHRELAKLVTAAAEAGEDFGACHIVVEDLNLEKHCLTWCLRQPKLTPQGKAMLEALSAVQLRDRAIAFAAINEKYGFRAYADEEWVPAPDWCDTNLDDENVDDDTD
jgi:hypothetical protein